MLINFVARANKCQGSVARKTGIKSREYLHSLLTEGQIVSTALWVRKNKVMERMDDCVTRRIIINILRRILLQRSNQEPWNGRGMQHERRRSEMHWNFLLERGNQSHLISSLFLKNKFRKVKLNLKKTQTASHDCFSASWNLQKHYDDIVFSRAAIFWG